MDDRNSQVPPTFPALRSLGLDAVLVRFADRLEEAPNRAALAFRAALEAEAWPELAETATSLAAVLVRFDPLAVGLEEIGARLRELLARRDWYRAPLPAGRRLWRVPCVYGTDLAPQLEEAAEAAGLSAAQAVADLGQARVRVLALGFAPGQPYLGPLAEHWNLPRQAGLTPRVPAGALVLAIRQLVLFAGPAPTGWRHVGQTAFRPFRPGHEEPIALRPGDEMIFEPARPALLERLRLAEADRAGNGGATVEEIAP